MAARLVGPAISADPRSSVGTARQRLALDAFHVPRSLHKAIRRGRHEIRVDTAFERTIRACAAPMLARPQTWLNEELIGLYVELHRRGHAHSVETWQGGELVGGLFYHNYPGGNGLTSGAVFGRRAGRSASKYARERQAGVAAT